MRSAISSVKILEINEDGKFVRLFNASGNEDLEVGGFLIQQNVGGHPVAVFRFPPRTRFRAGSVITVSIDRPLYSAPYFMHRMRHIILFVKYWTHINLQLVTAMETSLPYRQCHLQKEVPTSFHTEEDTFIETLLKNNDQTRVVSSKQEQE